MELLLKGTPEEIRAFLSEGPTETEPTSLPNGFDVLETPQEICVDRDFFATIKIIWPAVDFPTLDEIPKEATVCGDTTEKLPQTMKTEAEFPSKKQTVTRWGVKFRNQWHMPLELLGWLGAIVEVYPNGIVCYKGHEICQLDDLPKDKDDQALCEELIEGKRKAKNAAEAVISRTKRNAGRTLAYIGINHPASELIFKYFVAQNYPDLKQRLARPTLRTVPFSDSELEMLNMIFPNRQKN